LNLGRRQCPSFRCWTRSTGGGNRLNDSLGGEVRDFGRLPANRANREAAAFIHLHFTFGFPRAYPCSQSNGSMVFCGNRGHGIRRQVRDVGIAERTQGEDEESSPPRDGVCERSEHWESRSHTNIGTKFLTEVLRD
jgi:hypothetical protein